MYQVLTKGGKNCKTAYEGTINFSFRQKIFLVFWGNFLQVEKG